MKPKVSAVIQSRANTLVLDFPKSIAELRVALLQSGIPEPPRDIFLMDNEGDPIREKSMVKMSWANIWPGSFRKQMTLPR